MTIETYEWRKQPEHWICPSCMRRKEDCEVPKGDGQTLRWLVRHHDHMKDFVKAYVKDRYGRHDAITSRAEYKIEAMRFIDRVAHLAKRFDDVVICLDCNEVEGRIKTKISADKYFTFHPLEIRRAYIPRPKQRHEFVDEHMEFYRRIYSEHKNRLVNTRKQLCIDLIESVGSREQFWGEAINQTAMFTQEDLYVRFPVFDSGRRITEGLLQGKPVLQGMTWIEEHNKIFQDLVAFGSTDETIAKVLGRTASAVKLRRETLAEHGVARTETDRNRNGATYDLTPAKAQQIIGAVAKGIDPETGNLLSPDNLLNSPHIIRALLFASKALDAVIQKIDAKDGRPSKAGKPWPEAEDEQLLKAFDAGATVHDLASIHERSAGGIASRLVRLGRITERSDAYACGAQNEQAL